MSKNRKKYSSAFKAKIALLALQEKSTIVEIAKQHNIHPNIISKWKNHLISNSVSAFDENLTTGKTSYESQLDKLHAKIGQLTIEQDFLKKNLKIFE